MGVIGLGEVAQVIHLPVIESLPDRYELAAVCDISPGLLKRVGDRYRVARRYTDAAEMIAAGGLDCVLVLNSDFGHDGFLIETEAVGNNLRRLLAS